MVLIFSSVVPSCSARAFISSSRSESSSSLCSFVSASRYSVSSSCVCLQSSSMYSSSFRILVVGVFPLFFIICGILFRISLLRGDVGVPRLISIIKKNYLPFFHV